MAGNLNLGIIISAIRSSSVDNAFRSVITDTDRVANAERRLQRQISRTQTLRRNSERRSQLRGSLLGTAGLAFSAAAPIKAAIEFESVMADVNKVTNLNKVEFKAMGQSILDMSTTMPIAASGIGDIVAAAGQSGIAKDQLLSFAKSAAKMGIAFDISASEAGKMMANWRTGMNLTQDQTVQLADATNFLSNNMNATASAIGQVIQRQGAVAKAAGLSAVQTAALSAALLSSGAAPEIAATALKNLTGALTKGTAATASQKKAFSALGFNAVEMSKRMQTDAKGAIMDVFKSLESAPKSAQGSLVSLLFGEEAKGAIMPLLANMENLKKAFNSTSDATKFAGSMQNEYDVRSKTTANSLILLKNQTVRLGISIGSVLLPGLNTVVGVLGGVIDGVTTAADKFPFLTTVIVGAAVGLIAFKVVSLGVRFAVTVLSDGLVFARAVVDFFRISTLRANAALVIQKATVVGLTIQQKAMAVWTGTVTAAQWLWNAALTANPIGPVIAGVTAFGALAFTVYKNWQPIMDWFKQKFAWLSKSVSWVKGIGGFFGNSQPSSPQKTGNGKAAAVIAATLSASPAVASQGQQNQIHNTIHITQQAGEDSEQLAKRITELQHEQLMRLEQDVR